MSAAVLLLVAVCAAVAWCAHRGRSTAPRWPVASPEPEPLEPWRDTHPAAVLLSTDLLFRLVDPGEYTTAATHRFRVEPLADQIEAEGLREPGVLHMDAQGKTVLADGNHRLVAHIENGWPAMPVELRNVRLIRGFGVPARTLVDALLTERNE